MASTTTPTGTAGGTTGTTGTTPTTATLGSVSSGLAGFLSAELTLLAAEAKRKPADANVKDAAELLLALIKSLKPPSSSSTIVSPATSASDSIAIELAKTADSVRPFILACDSKSNNAKMSAIAIGCLQRLTMHHAVLESSVPRVLKAMADVALIPNTDQNLQLKVLQTVLPLLSGYLHVGGTVIAESLLLCYRLQDAKSPIVSNIASATLRQIVLHTFERVNHEDEDEVVSISTAEDSKPYAKDAHSLFKDLCLLSIGEQPLYFKILSMPKGFCLELIESVLSSHWKLFRTHEDLLSLVKERVCPALMRSFSETGEFPITLRIIRIIHATIKYFHEFLVVETEVFLSLYIRLLEPDHAPSWLRVIVLESIKSLIAIEFFLRNIFQAYDANPIGGAKIFSELLVAVRKIIVVEKQAWLIIPRDPTDIIANGIGGSGGSGGDKSSGGGSVGDGGRGSAVGGAISTGAGLEFLCLAAQMVKTPVLELVDKTDPPNIPESYLTALCVQCILNATENQTSVLVPRLISATPNNGGFALSSTTSQPPIFQDELILGLEMATASHPVIIATLAILLIGNVEHDLYKASLRAYAQFTILVGLLGLVQQRDSLLSTLCRISAPPTITSLSCDATAVLKELTGIGAVAAGAVQNFGIRISHAVTPGGLLGERNLSGVVALCNACVCLQSVLDRASWYVVLETVQAVEAMHSSGKMDRRETAAIGSFSMGSGISGGGAISVAAAGGGGGSVMANPVLDSLKMIEGGRKLSLTALANVAAALAGGSGVSAGSVDLNLPLAIKNLFEGSMMMGAGELKEFIAALCALCENGVALSAAASVSSSSGSNTTDLKKDKIIITTTSSSDEKLFCVAKLHEVVLLNNARIVTPPDEIFEIVVNCLIDIAHSANCTPGIRNQVCVVFGDILTASIQSAEQEEGRGIVNGAVIEMKLLEPLKRFMLVSSEDVVPAGVPISGEYDKVIKGAWFLDVQKTGLETVKKILMSSGHNLVHGWFLIFEVIRSVVVGGKKAGASGNNIVSTGALMNLAEVSNTLETSTTQPSKAAFLVKAAFPSIQLICGDFLGSLGPEILYECIQTLGCFGSQPDDINISLTTIGLLWNISDNIITRRQKLEKEGKTESPVHSVVSGLDISSSNSSTASSKAMLTSRENLSGLITTKAMDSLWMHLLAHLSHLCSDLRPEVRNTANQTIFKTISINGKRLSLDAWDECIWNILFPLLEKVKISSEQAEHIQHIPTSVSGSINGIPINPRDSPTKFWNETKTLTLTGITNLIVGFFPILIDLPSGFEKIWSLFLDYIRSWALGGSAEVATAAIKGFKTLVRYPKDLVEADGVSGKVALNIQRHLLELWRMAWDTWEGIGIGIVSETNENKSTSKPQIGTLQKSASGFGSQLIAVEKLTALHGSFPQATLVVYISIFADIYDIICPSFGLYEFKKLVNVLGSLLLYHTISPPGITVSKYRTDNVTDLETMSPVQEAIFSLITGTNPEFSEIKGSSEIIMLTVAGFIRLPFVRMQSMSDEEKEIARVQPQTGGMDKGLTHMALAKRSIQILVSLFEEKGSSKNVYSDGIFESILSCLDLPMRMKYDCPSAGLKDSTPLWRVAANAAMTLVVAGLKNVENFVSELPKDILNGIYSQILDMFDGFLLPQSSPPPTMNLDELDVATDFDISIFETFETDVLLHLGQLHVPDELIRAHVEIIARSSKLYRSHMSSMADLSLPTTFKPRGDSVRGSIDMKSANAFGSASLTNARRKSGKDDDNSLTRQSLVSSPKPFDQKANLGTDVMPLGREKFSKACLVSMFSLCSDEANDMKEERYRIATIAAPIVLEKIREVIKSYASDRPLYGRLPLPRIRSEEISLVLTHLRDLEMRIGILHHLISEDKIHPLRSHILSGRSAHLFYLYPQLCELLTAVAKAYRGGGMSPAEADEEALIDLVNACLSRVGREMGMDF
ncbi:hypothetical protein HK100_010473 [Physocladia obscura]|uniref:Uncharacterized protein n=1 Tax=Physocladia obscura TaxID=109957 RepID=A0AAD5TAG5_9FUNG|nr:hypothetical protein HK100_010473 [Physocladia obscura]